LANEQNFTGYNSIVLDSASYLMNVHLKNEIAYESYDAQKDSDKIRKPLVNQTKLSLEDYGGLSSQMCRLMALLGRLSAQDRYVVVIALATERPKWNVRLAAAPAFLGRQFPDNMPAYFDWIGYVYSRGDDNGQIVYPPMVAFESVDNSFMAKWTGVRPNSGNLNGPLDFGQLINSTQTGNTQKESDIVQKGG